MRTVKNGVLGVLLVVLMLGTAALGQSPIEEWETVTWERLLNPPDGEWLHYHRTLNALSYSPLEQINKENVQTLQPAWAWSSGDLGRWQVVPVVANGIMFVAESRGHVIALDAASGNELWRYVREYPEGISAARHRGVSVYQDMVFFPAADAFLVALDARTGEVVWEVDTGLLGEPIGTASAHPPLVVDGKLLLGHGGGDAGFRGRMTAYESETGELLWTTYTIPLPGEPGSETWNIEVYGGAAPWLSPSYDPELRLLYWATGQPAPWNYAVRGPGDALYSNNILAVDIDTGEIVWNFPVVPADTWDYDSPFENILVDLDINGETRKALIHVSKVGWGLVLDRETGEFLHAFETGYDDVVLGWTDEGRPIYDEEKFPTVERHLDTGETIFACPGTIGVRSLGATSYSPRTGYVYVPANEQCSDFEFISVELVPGERIPSGVRRTNHMVPGFEHVGNFMAIDPVTGERVWDYQLESGGSFSSAALSTAGGVVFGGSGDRWFIAFDDETGEVLWRTRLNAGLTAAPISYEIDGRQYIAVTAASAGFNVGARMAEWMPEAPPLTEGTPVMWVFALPEADMAEQ